MPRPPCPSLHAHARAQALSREFEIDFISLSYTRSEEDVHEARAWLSSLGLRNTRVLAKLETRQSLFNLDGILSAADGVIISRGAPILGPPHAGVGSQAGQSRAGSGGSVVPRSVAGSPGAVGWGGGWASAVVTVLRG